MNNYRDGVTSIGLSVFILAAGAIVLGQQAPVGYDDTPMQPNGKWRIHDGKRPQPAMVAPGRRSSDSAAAACRCDRAHRRRAMTWARGR